ncbi:hypothetical protein PL8927_270212 [Planktothrix serta PCC 8927]|uniref:Uncharacterized protein n=1 Tax=Planktothrix serta PCC 8927 TaxID=671068 RepID=A0A7Z9DX90_9CYAN|nr:hypothetical protein PL8927_270212 [Planktothrix serta PCC 8927]
MLGISKFYTEQISPRYFLFYYVTARLKPNKNFGNFKHLLTRHPQTHLRNLENLTA